MLLYISKPSSLIHERQKGAIMTIARKLGNTLFGQVNHPGWIDRMIDAIKGGHLFALFIGIFIASIAGGLFIDPSWEGILNLHPNCTDQHL